MRKVAVGLSLCLLAGVIVPLTACKKGEARSSYRITAEYFPETRTLTAEMEVTAYNRTENPFTELKFQLHANAFREGADPPVSEMFLPSAYYKGMSYGSITVDEVRGAKSYAVGGEAENILTVTLNDELWCDESVTLNMAFEVVLPEIDHRLGVGEHTVNLTGFYPILCPWSSGGFTELLYTENGDPFVSECADYTLDLTLPEGYTLACGGTVESALVDGKRVYHVGAMNVREIAVVFGKELKTVTQDVDGIAVEYCYLTDPTPTETLTVAAESLKYFSKTFGNYAYPRYTVVETDLPFGGMEYPSIVLIARNLGAEMPAVVAHETAHQWWYAMVGSDQYGQAWQDEGLAEYSAALFFGEHPKYGITYKDAVGASERAYRAYFSVLSQRNGADTTMSRPLTSFSGAYEYRSIAYDKGVILFDRVRSVAGDRRFFSALENYFDKYAGKIAAPEELISCFRGAGADMEGLFRSFTEGLCVI